MSAAVIRFPRPMKRGAKVRRGPCAQMLHFPVPLSGAPLYAEWQWLDDHNRWENEELPEPDDMAGFDQAKFDRRRWLSDAVREGMGREAKTDNDLRCDVAEWRAEIKRRHNLKAWLREQGATADDLRNAESALAFAFDVAHGV